MPMHEPSRGGSLLGPVAPRCWTGAMRSSQDISSTTFVNKGKKRKDRADTGLGKRRDRYGSYILCLMLRHTTKPLCPVHKNTAHTQYRTGLCKISGMSFREFLFHALG